MSASQHQVTEGEFRRLAATKSMTRFIAQEAANASSKFHLLGVDEHNQIIYAVRHGRVPDLRTWRIDILVELVKSLGADVTRIEILLNPSKQ